MSEGLKFVCILLGIAAFFGFILGGTLRDISSKRAKIQHACETLDIAPEKCKVLWDIPK